ncbi:MAG TPA: FAD-dependent oxidoreductase [Myxococcota bacterium]|nr:FAD-dependent oxidoreductase [Myxococcota bacterium]
MSDSVDVAVIGGGVVGVASAAFLAERGARVVLLERGEICSGASYGNAGWISPSHGMPLPSPGVVRQALRWLLDPESPFYVKPRFDLELALWLLDFLRASSAPRARATMRANRELILASLALYEKLAAEPGPDFGFARRGLVVACESPQGMEHAREELDALAELGGGGRELSNAELRALAPRASPELRGGLYFPADAHLDPERLVLALAERAAARGAALWTRQEVLELQTRGRRIERVVATRGELRAAEVVLAAGAWSPQLAAQLGLRLPVQAAKGYSVTVERPADFGEHPLLLSEAKVAVTPLGEALRFAGTLELAGLDLRVNARRVGAILRAVERFLPGLAASPRIETWRGLRPLTPDDRPILGRPRAFDNLIVATGHGMSGISQGPMTAQLVAELCRGEPPSLPLAPFSPDRFG